MDTKSGLFFSHARLSGAWPEAEAVSRSAVTKARAKISWKAFEEVHHQAVALAYTLWPAGKADTWQGLSVFAIDGSKYDLPATEAVCTSFDPRSGLQYPETGRKAAGSIKNSLRVVADTLLPAWNYTVLPNSTA